jgi:SAM-dependent methyltransferase
MAYFAEAEARSIIRTAYGRVEPRSRAVAEDLYAPAELEGLPADAVMLALGVGHPLRHVKPLPGEVVLDVGCGAGLDALLAGRLVGPAGSVIAVDMTPEMVARTRQQAALAGLTNVDVREGLMEALPVADGTVDAVTSNGTLNLSNRPSRALAEMLRVLRPGGRLGLADLVVNDALPEEIRRSAPALAA